MKKTTKKSGRSRFNRKKIVSLYHESADRVNKHFSDNFVSRIRNVHEVRLWVIEWVLLVAVVILFGIVQAMWYGDSYETEAYIRGGEYTEAVLGEIDSMNPLYATNSAERTLSKLLFADLVSPDKTGHNKAELAKTVKMDDTGRVWTVALRDNIYWSDGEPITADDIIYTVDLIRDTTAKTTISADFSKVNLKKIDDKTVEFVLPSAYLDFMDILEFPLVPKHILGDISPALVYESEFSTKPVGSGPFVLNAVQVVSGANSTNTSTIYLDRNEKYFKASVKLEDFRIKTYKDREDIIKALNNSEATGTAELGVELNDEELSKKVATHDSLLNGGVFAFINTKSDNLNNVNVRQGIQRGVDMNEVRGDLESSRHLNYPILKSQYDLAFPEIAGYDLNAAKELIGKVYKYNEEGKVVGANGAPVTLKAAVQRRDTITKVAERFVEQLKKLGFEVSLNIYEESQTVSDFFSSIVRPRDYDILFYEVDLGVSTDPFVYYSSTQASTSGWNFSNYSNGLVDDALLSAHTTTNTTTRKAKYEYFLKAWVNDVPAIALYQSSLRYYYADGVQIFSSDMILTDALDRFGDVQHWATQKKKVNVTP